MDICRLGEALVRGGQPVASFPRSSADPASVRHDLPNVRVDLKKLLVNTVNMDKTVNTQKPGENESRLVLACLYQPYLFR